MKSTHTPGPWEITTLGGVLCIVKDDGDTDIGIADGVYRRADARLIAAAPDLLVALEQIENMPGGHRWWEYQTIARNAIAKARGD